MSLNHTSHRAFTLTEMAIVLGVIGIILGAIWSAYSAVDANLKATKAAQQILTIAANVRALHTRDKTFTGAINAEITSSLANLGAIPQEMLQGTSANGRGVTATGPWGNGVIVYQQNTSAATNITTYFAIAYFDLPKPGIVSNACASLLAALPPTKPGGGNIGTPSAPGGPVMLLWQDAAANSTIITNGSGPESLAGQVGSNCNNIVAVFDTTQ